jgi:membrane protease YdiL (CAAX protease family)
LSPKAAWIEVGIAYALIEAAVWTEGNWKLIWSLAAAVCIFILVFRRRPSLRELGLGVPPLRGTLWTLLITVLLAGAILVFGWVKGTWNPANPRWPPLENPHLYAIWVLEQQFMLQSFFYLRLESALHSSRLAVLVTAVLFSAAHIPNPWLVVATLAGGLFFCETFRRYRNLYVVSVAHVLLGFALVEALGLTLLHHLRVGIGFLHNH